jgi:hypothetical protein
MAEKDKPKLTRDEKKLLKAAKRQQRRQTFTNLKQAFTLTRQNDPKLIPILLLFGLLGAAIGWGLVYAFTGSWWIPIPFAVILGSLVALIVFSRRAQSSMYAQAEGQVGAAGWLLSQQLKGDWTFTQAVAGNQNLDVVHRLVGRAGVVLVAEGAPGRLGGLIAQEKKKLSRLTGDTPIYDIRVGTGEGDVRLGKLQRSLLKLPANLSKDELAGLRKRLSALDSGRMPIPQGPMPQGAKMRNVQRAVNRRRG